ncbi:hypothetical protein Trydic_g5989 [Trypoxylus dichotomus]
MMANRYNLSTVTVDITTEIRKRRAKKQRKKGKEVEIVSAHRIIIIVVIFDVCFPPPHPNTCFRSVIKLEISCEKIISKTRRNGAAIGNNINVSRIGMDIGSKRL